MGKYQIENFSYYISPQIKTKQLKELVAEKLLGKSIAILNKHETRAVLSKTKKIKTSLKKEVRKKIKIQDYE